MAAERVRAYQRCTVTVMDTTDPDITFDENGVSSYVGMFTRNVEPVLRRAQAGERLAERDALVARIKADGRGKPYDVVIGVSGGVDSTFLTLSAVRLGLRPLLVHFDSGWNSEAAVDNIHNLVTSLGLDLYTQVVDWREMKDLQLSFLKSGTANADTPTDHAFGYVSYSQAQKYGIKHILAGFNFVSESILPTAWGYTSADAKLLRSIQRRFGTVKLKTYPVMGQLTRTLWYPYVRRIETHSLLNFAPYHYDQAKAEISAEVGWRDYGGKHYESVFTRWFQGYYLPQRFGFDKRLAHYTSLILAGEMTRDEALEKLDSTNYPDELRAQDHEFMAKKLGITVAELDAIVASPPRDYTDYPNSEKSTKAVFDVTTRVGAAVARLRGSR
ncbi:MAG: N-acetyl sugar amidotransferase [Pseudolysinimonas sp.]